MEQKQSYLFRSCPCRECVVFAMCKAKCIYYNKLDSPHRPHLNIAKVVTRCKLLNKWYNSWYEKLIYTTYLSFVLKKIYLEESSEN